MFLSGRYRFILKENDNIHICTKNKNLIKLWDNQRWNVTYEYKLLCYFIYCTPVYSANIVLHYCIFHQNSILIIFLRRDTDTDQYS